MAKNTDFDNLASLERPRDKAWTNWFKAENVGDQVAGYIRDVFYRPADGQFGDARGITLETPDGELVNVSIKTLPFIMAKTDHLRLGDPLKVVFEKQEAPKVKGYSGVKVFGFYGSNLEGNAGNPTVRELYEKDKGVGGTTGEAEAQTEEGGTVDPNDDFLPPHPDDEKKS